MDTPHIAVISKEWKRRMLLIILIVAGSGAWFMFDGLVTYPGSNVRWTAHSELKEIHGDKTPALETAWKELTRQKGWDPIPPKKFYSKDDINTQLILGGLLLVAGAFCATHYFRSLPTTTQFHDGVITLPDGRRIALTQIVSISKKRWDNKGIADLVYEEDRVSRKFIIDDYKYIGGEAILKEAEASLASRQPGGAAPANPKNDSPGAA